MSAKHVTVTLSEEAFQLARAASHRDVALHRITMGKILDTRIDISLGNEHLCRHPILTLDEARELHEYYRRATDTFIRIGDTARALIAVKARATIRHEIWKAAFS